MQASACNFIKKEALAQVFSCEFCEISKNNFFTEYLRTTAFVNDVIGLPVKPHLVLVNCGYIFY